MAAEASRSGRLSLLVAALLAGATVFFVWGALAERSGHAETSQEGAGEAGHATGESGEARAESEYRPFGVNLESTPLVLGAAFVSLVLAALVALRRRRTILLGVVALAAGFTALEILEVVHQADVNRSGLSALALIAGILHAAAALLAARLLVLRMPTPP